MNKHALGSHPRNILANLLYIECSRLALLLAFWLQTLWQRSTLAVVWSLAKYAKSSFHIFPYLSALSPTISIPNSWQKIASVPPVGTVFAQWRPPFVPWPWRVAWEAVPRNHRWYRVLKALEAPALFGDEERVDEAARLVRIRHYPQKTCCLW